MQAEIAPRAATVPWPWPPRRSCVKLGQLRRIPGCGPDTLPLDQLNVRGIDQGPLVRLSSARAGPFGPRRASCSSPRSPRRPAPRPPGRRPREPAPPCRNPRRATARPGRPRSRASHRCPTCPPGPAAPAETESSPSSAPRPPRGRAHPSAAPRTPPPRRAARTPAPCGGRARARRTRTPRGPDRRRPSTLLAMSSPVRQVPATSRSPASVSASAVISAASFRTGPRSGGDRAPGLRSSPRVSAERSIIPYHCPQRAGPSRAAAGWNMPRPATARSWN